MVITDLYAAIHKVRGGAIHGVVRSIYSGIISECAHSHKTVSTAIACAEKQLKGLDK